MSEKTKFILKIVEITVTVLVGGGTIWSTMKAAKMSEEDKKDIAEETARILLESVKG